MNVFLNLYCPFFTAYKQKIEEYSKDASELVSKMTSLHQRLSTLDGIRMTESDDDVESYWEIGIKLVSTARHILQSGLFCIIFFI